MIQYPDFLTTIFEQCSNATVVETVSVDQLKIRLCSEERGYINWLLKYLGPLIEPAIKDDRDCHPNFKVGCLFSDDLVSEVSRFIEAGKMDYFHVSNGKRYVQRLIFSPEIIVDYDMEPGVVCAYNLKVNTVTIITSAHTTHPIHEMARCIRDLITYYLRGHGWDIFHAGAAKINDQNYLVVGNQGAGKTSLIIALLFGGAEFIANDRVFIKSTADGVLLRPFPMTIAIGLGTALQYPQLKYYLSNPGSLTYPRLRFDLAHVHSYPENKWPELKDKLQMFPDELVHAFGKDKSHRGGIISGVLFPKISEFQGVLLQKPGLEAARNLLTDNYFPWETDPVIPPWRPFDFTRPDNKTHQKSVENLLDLPLVDFTFLASKNLMHEVRNYRDYLQQFISDIFVSDSGFRQPV